MASIRLTNSSGDWVEFKPLGTNAICGLEEQLGLTFGQIMAGIGVTGVEGWSLRTTRQFLQVAAVEDISVEAIGDLIDHVGFDGIADAVNGLILPAQKR